MIWKILGVLAVTVGTIAFETPRLSKRGSKKDLAAFFVFLAFGTVYGILYVSGAKLSTPLIFMADISRPITDFLINILT